MEDSVRVVTGDVDAVLEDVRAQLQNSPQPVPEDSPYFRAVFNKKYHVHCEAVRGQLFEARLGAFGKKLKVPVEMLLNLALTKYQPLLEDGRMDNFQKLHQAQRVELAQSGMVPDNSKPRGDQQQHGPSPGGKPPRKAWE